MPEAKALELYLPLTLGIAGFTHFLYSQHHQNTELFVKRFKEFNERYDKLNEQLNAIVENKAEDLSVDDIQVLYNYFNLCAEEYLFYDSGYIDQKVWQSWLRGMQFFYNKRAAVRRLWASELKANSSYYGFKLEFLDPVSHPLHHADNRRWN